MTRFTDFRAGLLDPAAPVPDGLLDGKDKQTVKRYGVYRNNVTVSLIDALKTGFPLVVKLLGEQNFEGIVALYVRSTPPSSPLMMFYGAEFPEFLAGFQPVAHIGYLPDAAQLDLELRRSYHARDTDPFDPSPLADLSPEALMDATFVLAPATRIISSVWPLYDIWHYNQSSDAPKPRGHAQDVLITRPEFDPIPQPLPDGGALWLSALAAGSTFGSAHDKAANAHPSFDLTANLTLALNGQAFAEIHHKDLQ